MINNKIKEENPRFKKGYAFVETAPNPLVFMEINEVQESTKNMDFCIVTWYTLNEKGLHAQQRFLMGARDGKFNEYTRKLIELLPDVEEKLTLALQVEKEIVINTWFDCEENNYMVEENSKQRSMHITIVCVTSESYDEIKGSKSAEQFFYLRNNCPYSWDTLVKSGTKIFDALNIPVKVASDDKIEYEGRLWSLSAFTAEFLSEKMQNTSGAYQGPKFFSHEGKVLNELRKQKENK